MIAAIVAAVGAVLRADKDHVRVVGMHENDMDFGVFRQARAQRLPSALAGRTAEQPAAQQDAFARGSGSRAGENPRLAIPQGIPPL